MNEWASAFYLMGQKIIKISRLISWTSQVKSSQVKSSQVKSSQVKSSQVKSSQVKSSQVKSSQVKYILLLIINKCVQIDLTNILQTHMPYASAIPTQDLHNILTLCKNSPIKIRSKVTCLRRKFRVAR